MNLSLSKFTSLYFEKAKIAGRMKTNELATEDGIILIQSCDTTTANVGITTGNLTCYRRVSLPSLSQAEESRFYPWEMSDEEFAAILSKHAAAVVEMIGRLNTKGEPTR